MSKKIGTGVFGASAKAGLLLALLIAGGCDVIPWGDQNPAPPASPARGYILETNDGGLTWGNGYYEGKASVLAAVEYVENTDDQVVFIASGSDKDGKAVILRTLDWGDTWNLALSGYTSIDFIYGLEAGPLLDWAVAVGDHGAVFLSTSRGAGWLQRESHTTARLNAVDFDDNGWFSLVGFAVGDDGVIIRSEDSGDTWSTLLPPTTEDLRDVRSFGAFLEDEGFVVAVGTDGTVVRSEDAGDTWTVQRLPTGTDLNSVYFNDAAVNGGYGLAVSEDGHIYKSTDDGATWTPAWYINGTALRDVRISNLGMCVAVGEHRILRSTDQGKTWTIVYEDTEKKAYFSGLFLPDNSFFGLAVGKKY